MIQLPPLLLESTSQEACMNEGHPLTFKVHFHILCLQACCKSLRIGGSGGCGRFQRTEARSCCVRAGKEAFVLAREQPWQHAWSLCAPWKFIHLHRCSTNRTQSRSRSAPRQETHGCHGEAVLISFNDSGFSKSWGCQARSHSQKPAHTRARRTHHRHRYARGLIAVVKPGASNSGVCFSKKKIQSEVQCQVHNYKSIQENHIKRYNDA